MDADASNVSSRRHVTATSPTPDLVTTTPWRATDLMAPTAPQSDASTPKAELSMRQLGYAEKQLTPVIMPAAGTAKKQQQQQQHTRNQHLWCCGSGPAWLDLTALNHNNQQQSADAFSSQDVNTYCRQCGRHKSSDINFLSASARSRRRRRSGSDTSWDTNHRCTSARHPPTRTKDEQLYMNEKGYNGTPRPRKVAVSSDEIEPQSPTHHAVSTPRIAKHERMSYEWSGISTQAGTSSISQWLDLAASPSKSAAASRFRDAKFQSTHDEKGLSVERRAPRTSSTLRLLQSSAFEDVMSHKRPTVRTSIFYRLRFLHLMLLFHIFLVFLSFLMFDEFATGACWSQRVDHPRFYNRNVGEAVAERPVLAVETRGDYRRVMCGRSSRLFKPLKRFPLVHRFFFPFIYLTDARMSQVLEHSDNAQQGGTDTWMSSNSRQGPSAPPFVKRSKHISISRWTGHLWRTHFNWIKKLSYVFSRHRGVLSDRDNAATASKEHTVQHAAEVLMQTLNQRVFHLATSGRIEEALRSSPASLKLRQHNEEFRKRLQHVVNNVYVAIGYGLANVMIVDTSSGLVLIDALENPKAVREMLEDWIKLKGNVTLPLVQAIIYSHFHTDHVFGSSEAVTQGHTQVWAHEETATLINKVFSVIGGMTYKRSMRQFGSLLSEKEGYINAGIGPRLHYSAKEAGSLTAVAEPTHIWTGQRQTVEVGGEILELIHAPGETKDQTIVWMPKHRVLYGADNIYKSFPNIYAIRGTESRDSMLWARSLDVMRFLRPSYLVLGHTAPLHGEQLIWETITAYRDAIQYIHDQTVRYVMYFNTSVTLLVSQMNKGRPVDDIVSLIKLPPHLERHPYLQPFYGTVAWAVRAVFQHYVGWFSGQPEHLETLGTRMAKLVGGREALVQRALEALEANDLQWALELIAHASYINPRCPVTRRLHILTLRSLASTQTSAPGRNWLLTTAKELEDDMAGEAWSSKSSYSESSAGVPMTSAASHSSKMRLTERFFGQCHREHDDKENINEQLKISFQQKRQCINSLKTALESFSFLPVRIKAEDTHMMDIAIGFTFTDTKEAACIHLRRGVAYVAKTCDRTPDLKVLTTDHTWRQLLLRELNPVVAVTTGRLRVLGIDPRNYFRLRRVLSLIETAD